MKKVNKTSIYSVLFFIGILYSCEKKEVPTVTTTDVTVISVNTAKSGGEIISDGGSPVITSGICWSVDQDPSIEDNLTSDGTQFGAFISNLTSLDEGTKYYVKAYATNSVGTGYGDEISFTTLEKTILFNTDLIYGTISDIETNQYKTIEIGTQTWMAENLRTTKYSNGDLIATTSSPTTNIEEEDNPKYQWPYDGDENNAIIYGRLYTWHAITDNRNVCPTGWHVPNMAEWKIMIDYLGGIDIAGGKLKETGTEHWKNPNVATNESGFTALGSGLRNPHTFWFYRDKCFFWSSTEYTDYFSSDYWITHEYALVIEGFENKYNGLSVRCVKD